MVIRKWVVSLRCSRVRYLLRQIYCFFRYDIHYGIINLISFFKPVWKYRSYDNEYGFKILLKHFELIEKTCELHRNVYGDKRTNKDLKRIKIILELIKRKTNHTYVNEKYFNGLKEDQFPDILSSQNNIRVSDEYERCLEIKNVCVKHNHEMLYKYLKKYSDCFWY